jgi:hypothetical protein
MYSNLSTWKSIIEQLTTSGPIAKRWVSVAKVVNL